MCLTEIAFSVNQTARGDFLHGDNDDIDNGNYDGYHDDATD